MSDRKDSAIWLDYDPPHISVSWGCYSWQNSTHIKRRANRLLERYARGWRCRRCNELMPVWKRIDAVYCSESCRKLTARKRQMAKMLIAADRPDGLR